MAREKQYGEKYYLGLDMGTSSVGWALTDENYQIRRIKGKDAWGCRLFAEANTSKDRRTYRTSRRRKDRERARIGFLREYFADEIGKVDPGFYVRLDESKYHYEDRSETNRQPYALFHDDAFTDKDYYDRYPTIFHLRKALLEDQADAFDVRLVFLALLNMFKHRGNFLNESLSVDNISSNIADVWQEFCNTARDELFESSFPTGEAWLNENTAAVLEEQLCNRSKTRTERIEECCTQLHISKKDKASYEIIRVLAGCVGKLKNIFGDAIHSEDGKFPDVNFRSSDYDETEEQILAAIGEDRYELIRATKAVHDALLISQFKNGADYISIARVKSYDQHHNDLMQLKRVLRKYNPGVYNRMFRAVEETKNGPKLPDGSYSSYVGSTNSRIGGKVRRGTDHSKQDHSLARFSKEVAEILKKCPQDDSDVQDILNKIANADDGAFMPLQLTSANGVIPNQLFAAEMKEILRNAEKYLPFLLEMDESGLTVSERILRLFSFRIPYYVGPVGMSHHGQSAKNIWSMRKEPGRILPWNIEQKIDTSRSAEQFINRMVRHCTYLSGETVLPKGSLLYEKYMVLNELNNLRINGEKIDVGTKQDIYKELFLKGKRVTVKGIQKYFESHGCVLENGTASITGIDTEEGIKSQLRSIGRFRTVLGDDVYKDSAQRMIEQIIFWLTVYGDDKRFAIERIREAYPELSDKQCKIIRGFRYTDWGNLSREFLEMTGADGNDAERSIIRALWDTNENLMQLLSDQHTYKKGLDNRVQGLEKSLSEWQPEDLDDMYLSAPVKRMIWQTIRVVDELSGLSGHTPDRVYVEMPRSEAEKVRTRSRKRQLEDLYKNALKDGDGKMYASSIHDLADGLKYVDDQSLRRKKLYLYYVQMGRCMYTGELIDLDTLLTDNTAYDIDHIYPRHFIKDDSIENNLVLVRKQFNQDVKKDVFPLPVDTQRQMAKLWKFLVSKKFITEEKYKRLTRKDEFTEQEKAAFIARQLVETRQGTKAITGILQAALPEAEIIFSKAGEVSSFRRKYDLLKVRSINDLHHAKDAYLNIVVGNTYYVKFTRNPYRFIRDAARHPEDPRYQYNMDKIFDRDVITAEESAWRIPRKGSAGSIATVRDMMRKNTPIISERTYVEHGGLTQKDTVYGASIAKEGVYMPMSSNGRLCDVTKYGGRTGIAIASYCLVEYVVSGKLVKSIEALPICLGATELLTEEQIKDYLLLVLQNENKGKTVERLNVKKKCIQMNSLIRLDGFLYRLRGKSEDAICLNNAQSLILDDETSNYIYKMEREDEGGNGVDAQQNCHLYHVLLTTIAKYYSNRKNTIYQQLVKYEDNFKKSDIKEQVNVLKQILLWLQLNNSVVDMKAIGGPKKAGYCRMSKKFTGCKELLLINRSVTGLYEFKEDLLRL